MFGTKHWEQAEGTIVDRSVKKERMDAAGNAWLIYEYVADVQLPSGEVFRTQVADMYLKIVQPKPGAVVGFKVDPKSREVVFDDKDPRLNVKAQLKALKVTERHHLESSLKQPPGSAPPPPILPTSAAAPKLDLSALAALAQEPPAGDPVSKLAKLVALRDAGALSEEQFEMMKERIISGSA
jgi:hypothetical protein